MEIQQKPLGAESSEEERPSWFIGEGPGPENGATGGKRENFRSTIAFPYADLGVAVEVARTLHDRFGNSAAPDQLAAGMGSTSTSGTFRTKLASARMFGAIEVGRKLVSLTDLGVRLADAHQEMEARVDAFLNVPLYLRVYEDNLGRKLPGDKGLENMMKELGVSPKQLNKARIVFQRSAEQAGFFAHGNDRLVKPNGPKQPAKAEPTASPEPGPASRQVHDDDSFLDGLHPLLVGLIKTIPREGDDFSPRRQKQWLEAAKVNFALIFGGDDEEPAS